MLPHVGFAGSRCLPLAERLARAGTPVAWCDPAHGAAARASRPGVTVAANVVALTRALAAPRVVWLEVDAGSPTEIAIQDVWPECTGGDAIVDAGDSLHGDAARRAQALFSPRVHFVDCGRLPAPDAGADTLLFGAHPAAADAVRPLMQALAGSAHGALHCGPPGAAHFARSLLQALDQACATVAAEAIELLAGQPAYGLDVGAVARAWQPTNPGAADFLARALAGREHGAPDMQALAEMLAQRRAAPVLSLALVLALRKGKDRS